MIITDDFKPFFGVVEDVNDPDKLGRIRVRCYGYHTQNKQYIPTDFIRWFSCVVSNSAGTSGKGDSPTGYVTGSTVFGYFLSSELQDGIVIGSLTGKPTETVQPNQGFNDPNGVYPLYVDEQDVNRLARNENISTTIVQTKKDGIRKNVATTTGTWSEPETPYNAVYPKNDVSEQESGHIHETDDTPGSERLHEYHKSGTFREIHPDGTEVVKIVTDRYTIIAGNGYFCVDGNANGFVGGNNDLVIDGTNTINVKGKSTLRAPEIQLGEDADVEPSVLGNKLASWIVNELTPWLNLHQHIGNLGYPTSAAALGPEGPFDPGTGKQGQAVYSKVNTNQ